jgi:hypothetical protein
MTRFADLLAAEWIKFRSLRATWWTLALAALALVAANANAAWSDHRNWPGYSPMIQADFVPLWSLRDAFTVLACSILLLAAGSVGALSLAGEYATGQIRTTFTAVPARRAVVAAKAVVVAAVLTCWGALVAGGSFAASQAILSGRGVGVTLTEHQAWRIVLASALLAPVAGLAGLGVAALVRHSAGSVIGTVLLLLLVPQLFSEQYHWSATVAHALPHGAWERLTQVVEAPVPPDHPWSVAGAWLVYALWPPAATAVAVAVVHRRDL